MARRISLAALTVLELEPPDMVSCAAEAGYDCLGLRLHPVMPGLDSAPPLTGDTPMARELDRRLTASGLAVLDVEFIRLEPDTRLDLFLPMLEAGARFGAKHVLCGGNDPDEARLAERFGALCRLAAPFGLTVNLEPIPLFALRTLAQARRVLAAAGAPNCGIVIDALHFDRAGERPENIAAIPAQWLHYLQLCDAPAQRPSDAAELQRQARYDRLPPGEGGLDLAGILRAVPPGLPLALEVPMAALARSTGAVERARRVRRAALALLERIGRGT